MDGSKPWLPESREAAERFYHLALTEAKAKSDEDFRVTYRALAEADLFFFQNHVLAHHDNSWCDSDWVFEACRMVQESPYGYLDLWSRGHFKTTIPTVAHSLWTGIQDTEETISIFSMTNPLAKAIGRQMKQYLEDPFLYWLWPDKLWERPDREAPVWSLDIGLILKRKGNPREATFEFHGLIDAMPTGRHFGILKFDDVVNEKYVTNQEMVDKASEAFRLSVPLGKPGSRRGVVGTRYSNADAYQAILDQGSYTPRIITPTTDGTLTGPLRLWDQHTFQEWIRDLGPYQSACQLFQRPEQQSNQRFLMEWLRGWKNLAWDNLNRFIIVDPAGEKKQEADYTVMAVVGLGLDGNAYLIDLIRDKLNLKEKADRLFKLHETYTPMDTYYEKIGAQTDIPFMEMEMERRQYRFRITPVGQNIPKRQRIETLQPLFAEGRFYLPEDLYRIDFEGKTRNLMREFIDFEFLQFPFCRHDDVLDCLARVTDGTTLKTERPIQWPKVQPRRDIGPRTTAKYDPVKFGIRR